jgi:oligopeptide transport system ATP-binding protein
MDLQLNLDAFRLLKSSQDIHGLWKASECTERIHFWLKRVGLRSEHASRFPHEFSGGQKQRIGIARALAIEPKFIVCDESISALDVSIQAQVVNLLENLLNEFKLTYLFIAHGLHMVRHISDRMAVMYLGQLVELGSSKDVFETPLHPYSEALFASNPYPDPEKERKRTHKLLVGEITSPVNPKPGCRFVARCPIAEDRCRKETPHLREIVPGRQVACHLR